MQNIIELSAFNRSDGCRIRTAYCLIIKENRVLIYDSERTFILRPPEYIQELITSDIKAGMASEQSISWLRNADLITNNCRKYMSSQSSTLPVLTDISIDITGDCNMNCVYCFEKNIFSRFGSMNNEIIDKTLNFAFEKCDEINGLSIHFGSGEPLIEFNKLKKIVIKSHQLSERKGIKVGFELTTNGTLVNREIAKYLAEHSFNVRVSCDGPPNIHNAYRVLKSGNSSYDQVERGLAELLAVMGDRVTVNSVICSGARLRTIWDWAKDLGVRRIHTVKVGSKQDSGLAMADDELSDYKNDLEYICNDLIDLIKTGQNLVEFQPITKIIRRLMLPAPIDRFCGASGSYLGVASNGKIYPCFRQLGIEKYCFGDVENGVDNKKRKQYRSQEAASVDNRIGCNICWARYLCGGGCYADPVTYGKKESVPLFEQCAFWKKDVETSIIFYDKIRNIDPTYCLRIFGDDIVSNKFDDQLKFIKNRKTV